MRTIVAGAAAVLLGSAALVVSAAAPAAADTSTVNATCKYLEVRIAGQPGSDNQLYYATSRASTGEPTWLDPLGTTFADSGYFLIGLDPGDSFLWRVEVHASDGTVLWATSGTTVACWPVDLGRTKPAVPPLPPCGSTLDDVAWPSTPGIVYSHDQWGGYARLQPGWQWDTTGHSSWMILNSVTSDLAYLQGSVILDPTGHCGIDRPAPPVYADPLGPCWYQAPKGPCPTPQSYTPTKPHVVAPGSASATKTAPPPPTSSPRPTVSGVTSAPPASPTPTPTVLATMAPSHAAAPPSPSATPSVQATPRVGTSTGLGVAGGVAGACVLAAAGAFVVRKRLHPTTSVVELDEPVD